MFFLHFFEEDSTINKKKIECATKEWNVWFVCYASLVIEYEQRIGNTGSFMATK